MGSGDASILVSTGRGTKVNSFTFYGRFDGRSDSDKGSTNRILLQLTAGLLARRRRWTCRHTGHLRKGPHDEHDHVADENSTDKNDNQPEDVAEQLFFLPLLGGRRFGVLVLDGDLATDHGEHTLG